MYDMYSWAHGGLIARVIGLNFYKIERRGSLKELFLRRSSGIAWKICYTMHYSNSITSLDSTSVNNIKRKQ